MRNLFQNTTGITNIDLHYGEELLLSFFIEAPNDRFDTFENAANQKKRRLQVEVILSRRQKGLMCTL